MMSVIRLRSSKLMAATFFCASNAALTASSTVANTPSREAAAVRGRNGGGDLRLQLDTKPGHNFLGDLRD